MPRRRFIWSRDLDTLVEVTPDYEQPGRDDARNRLASDAIYEGLQATDGTDISTRTKHRAYMRERGLTTVDDFTDTWKQAAEKRADLFEGRKGSVSKDDIGRAIHQLETRTRKS